MFTSLLQFYKHFLEVFEPSLSIWLQLKKTFSKKNLSEYKKLNFRLIIFNWKRYTFSKKNLYEYKKLNFRLIIFNWKRYTKVLPPPPPPKKKIESDFFDNDSKDGNIIILDFSVGKLDWKSFKQVFWILHFGYPNIISNTYFSMID